CHAPLQIVRQRFFLLLEGAPLEKELLIEAAHRERQEAAELTEHELHAPPAVENVGGDHLDQTEHVVEQKADAAVEVAIAQTERLLPGLRNLAGMDPERHVPRFGALEDRLVHGIVERAPV